MKIPALTLSLFAAALAAQAHAASHFENGVALTSDRVFRGVSQTCGDPGVIGELKWKNDKGPYAGLWASNLCYENRQGESVEILPFVGTTVKAGKGGFDIGLLYHYRPASGRDLDYSELTLAYDRKFGTTGMRLGVFLSPDGIDRTKSTYTYLDLRQPLGNWGRFKISASAHAGRFESARNGYRDLRLGMSASTTGLILSAAVSTSSLESQARFPGAGDAGTRAYATVTKMF